MPDFSINWVKEYGDQLFRFAYARVNDRIVAEDLVQDTFMAALKGYDNFKHQSSEKSWLFSILKNKIIDHYRAKGRNQTDSFENEEMIDSLFDETHHWKSSVQTWRKSPEEALDESEFQKVLQECLDRLPSTQRDVFAMRDLDGLSGEDVCKTLNVSASNLWVLMHRARLALRNCLTINWFGDAR